VAVKAGFLLSVDRPKGGFLFTLSIVEGFSRKD
jgi:hypothetical protein